MFEFVGISINALLIFILYVLVFYLMYFVFSLRLRVDTNLTRLANLVDDVNHNDKALHQMVMDDA